MAAPKDPEKKGLTLDLDIKKEPEREKPKAKVEENRPQFKNLNVTVMRPENPNPKTPKGAKSNILRPPRRVVKPKRKSFKINPFAALAGALVAGFLLSRFIGGMPSKAPEAERPKPTPNKTASKAVDTDQIPSKVADAPPVRDPHASIRAANLSQLGTDVDEKGNTSFVVKMVPKPSCMPGDMEAMRNVFGKTGSVLLTLEPMADGSKVPPVTRTVSLKEIEDGAKFSLPVNLKETGVYGIYLCGDADNTRKCGGKKPAEFNRILNFQNLESNANSVFYYQFSVIGLDYATVFTGLPNGINEARNELTQKKPNKDWKPQLDKASSMMRGVKSLPPHTTVEGNVVTLELEIPMISPNAQCG